MFIIKPARVKILCCVKSPYVADIWFINQSVHSALLILQRINASLLFSSLFSVRSVRFLLIKRVRAPGIRDLDHHHHLFAQNTIKIDNGYVNEQDRKAHCALTSAHNIT